MNVIELSEFVAISSIWFLVFTVFYFEPETVKKIAIWKLTIERDVTIAEDIRKQVEATASELKDITKLIIEDTYIVASSSMLAMGDSPASQRLEKNIDTLIQFVEVDKKKEKEWWDELGNLYPERKN
jgi:flagellar motor component MotA